jgi:hypothetical protein
MSQTRGAAAGPYDKQRRDDRKPPSPPDSEFPELPPARDLPLPRTTKREPATINLAVDFNDCIGGRIFLYGRIPDNYKSSFEKLINAGFRLTVLSYAGFTTDRREEVIKECKRYERAHWGHEGALLQRVIVVNHRLGAPFEHRTFGRTTGGKDFTCHMGNIRILIDDCEGTRRQ